MLKFFKPKDSSAHTAKSRLKLVLAQERIGLSESQMNQMKQELGVVISKYFKMDSDSLEIEVVTRDGQSALTVNTSVTTALHAGQPAIHAE